MNESNLTQVNSYCKYNEADSDIEQTVKLTTCLVVGGFGIFGNVFVIVLAVKYTVTKSLHFLIINMAVADTVFVIVNLFFYISIVNSRTSIWNNMNSTTFHILRTTLLFLYLVCATETLLTLLIICVERYGVTRQTVQILRPLSGERRVSVIAGSWLVSMVMNIPWLAESPKISLLHIAFPVYLTLMSVYFSSMVVLSILTLRRISKPQAIEGSLLIRKCKGNSEKYELVAL